MFRSDLRVRSVLSVATVSGVLGMDSGNGGIRGLTNTHCFVCIFLHRRCPSSHSAWMESSLPVVPVPIVPDRSQAGPILSRRDPQHHQPLLVPPQLRLRLRDARLQVHLPAPPAPHHPVPSNLCDEIGHRSRVQDLAPRTKADTLPACLNISHHNPKVKSRGGFRHLLLF